MWVGGGGGGLFFFFFNDTATTEIYTLSLHDALPICDADFDVKMIYEHTDADDDCCADLEVLPSGRNPASPAAPNSNGVVDGVADLDLDQIGRAHV